MNKPFLVRLVLGRYTGLVFGSMKGTKLVGSKNPYLPLLSVPFHMPGLGGSVGLQHAVTQLAHSGYTGK